MAALRRAICIGRDYEEMGGMNMDESRVREIVQEEIKKAAAPTTTFNVSISCDNPTDLSEQVKTKLLDLQKQLIGRY